MRSLPVLLVLIACNGGGGEDTEPVLDCDQTDPGGTTCSVDAQCRIECLCDDGSMIEAADCEGQCASAADLCGVYCQAVGWSGEHCFEPDAQ